jgi:hypothetical protein
MAVNKELWRPDIVGALFRSNRFLTRAFNADEYVVGGRIVHIPNAGAPSSVTKNRTSLPAAAVSRTDNDVFYSLDEFTSDPRLITDIDKKEMSFDKRQSIIQDDTGALLQLAGDNMIYRWIQNSPNTAGFRIASTGATAAATAPGATGTRKILTEADLRAAATALTNQNVPEEGRVAIISANALNHLMSDNNLKYAFQNPVNLAEGSIARLFTFDIYVRSLVAREATDGTIKTPEAANATTDNELAVFYHQNMVERAMGDVEIFDNPNRAEYYGDLISFLLRMGGRGRRNDNAGIAVVALRP